MPTLSIEERNFVIHRRHGGCGYGTIVKLLKDRGVSVCKKTVIKLCKKYEETGLVTDRKRKRPIIFGTAEHRTFLDTCIENEPSLTASELSIKIFERFGIRLSISAINKARTKLGYTQIGTRYCQMIRNENKVKRLEWCQRMLAANEQFDVSDWSLIIYFFS